MSEKTSKQSPPTPSTCVECGGPLSFAYYSCNTCQTAFCAKCRLAHIKKNHNKHYPSLTPMGCVVCGGPLDGQCSYCPAPLCHNWQCREKHEDRHFDTRSDEEKKNNPQPPKKR
ncbi:MAG: hypothetical protein UW11_C0041G0002 [Parcubacteria group bacterium GW2011_GWA2_43_9b]|nr:MAG: hypothetical protein UW11_C0041G0002 [Parcubacteria group bacterium GW2011_GWA2_43_9b]